MPESFVPENVKSLVEERERYRTFLARLEERAAEANPRAYERLKAEYEEKLHGIGEELARHVDAIRSGLQEAEAAKADLEGRQVEKSDELDEARLRHEVGEYADEKEWKAIERKLVKELHDLEAAVGRQRQEVASLTELLEQIELAAAAVAAEPAPQRPRPVAKPSPPARAGGRGAVPKAPRPTTMPEPEAAPAVPEGLGLEFLESLNLPEGEGEGEAEEEREEEGEGKEEGKEAGALPLLGERATGQMETIICPRCAAPNDSAEWYCVECGEELPAG